MSGPPASRDAIRIAEVTRLLPAIRQGDRASEARLWKWYEAEALYYAQRRLGDWHEAQDIAQEAFLGLSEAVRSGRLVDPARVGAYLQGICSHLVADDRHRRGRTVPAASAPEPTAPDDPAGEMSARQRERVLTTAVDSLPQGDRDVLELRYVEGMSFAQIAGLRRITAESARQVASRAIAKLRKKLRV